MKNGMIRATVITIETTDVIGHVDRLEELRQRFALKEHEANKARKLLEDFEQGYRNQLTRYPDLLAEFESELSELARRREERAEREARVAKLRKQRPTVYH